MPVDLGSLIRAQIAERRQALDTLEAAIDQFEHIELGQKDKGTMQVRFQRRRRRAEVAEGSVEERILTAVKDGASTMPAIMKAANTRPHDAKKFVRALVADGQLKAEGKGRWTTYAVA
jgi:predicted transcriptional regulator